MTLQKRGRSILKAEIVNISSLHWPDLDIDLEIDSLENPEKYPRLFR